MQTGRREPGSDRHRQARRSAALIAIVTLALAAAILGAAASAPSSAGAQTPQSQVSVSNLDETGTTGYCSARSDWHCAQGFTTGPNADGYTLNSVTARFLDKAGSPGDVAATLHATASGSALATLSGANPDTAGDYTFTCSGGGCSLDADTTYFVRFSSAGTDNNNEYRWKWLLNVFGETAIPANNGWSIADRLDYRPDGGAWNAATDLAAFLKVDATAVAPTPAPTPPADVDADSLALTMYGGTITAEWDHASGATSYHLTLKAQGAPGAPVDVNTAWPAFDGDGNAINRKSGDATKMSLTIADAATVAGHESGTYWFGLRAGNAAGSSAWKAKPVSPSAAPPPTATPTPTPTPTPAPEQAVTAQRGEDGETASITWTAYAGDGFEYYRVIVCDDSQYNGSSCSGTVFQSGAIYDAGSTGPVNVTGLDADTGYGVILQVWRNGSALKLHATLPALPRLETSDPTSNTMTLTLKNYSAPWHYTRQADGGTVSGCIGQEKLEYTYVHGLSAETTYTYKAYRDAQCSQYIAETTGTTTAPPSAGGAEAQSFGGLTAQSLGVLTATINSATSATLTLSSHSGNWYYEANTGPHTNCQGPVSGTTQTLSGLSGGTSYTYTAYSDSGCTQSIASETFYTIPPAPMKMYVYRICDSMQVGFSVVPGATGYNIEYNVLETPRYWNRITPGSNPGNGWWGWVTHFPRHMTWEWRARAFNDNGESGWTQAALDDGKPPPCQPTNVQARWSLAGIEISWTHGKRTTGYELAYSTDGGATWTSIGPNITGHNTGVEYDWSVPDITKTYVFAVRPENNGIKGGWTNSGAVLPGLIAKDITSLTATLELRGHSGNWWFKQTAPAEGTCTAGESDYSNALSGLVPATEYAYKAYSNDQCTAEIASLTFETDPVLVGNLDTSGGLVDVGTTQSGFEIGWGQAFTAGPNTGGYTLASASIRIGGKTNSPSDIVVTLHAPHTSNADNPGALLATLSGENQPSSSGTYVYTCSGSGCDLEAGKTYFIVVQAPGSATNNSFQVGVSLSTAETQEPDGNGWSLADDRRRRYSDGTWSTHTGTSGPLKLRVAAAPKPSLTAGSITTTTATLTLTNYAGGDWWLKRTMPTGDDTCHAGESDFSHALSNLTAGTTYTYKAYSKDGCASADEIAERTFKALPITLDAGSITTTTATLTLAGHTGNWWLKKTAPSPAGSCTPGEADFSHALSNLTAGTTYTYKAYSKDSCADADEIASETFSAAVTVSNLTKTRFGNASIGQFFGSVDSEAQPFTVGSHSGGYVLKSVEIDAGSKTGSPASFVIALHAQDTGNSSNPASTALVTLSGSSDPGSDQNYTYTCSGSGCNLAAGRTYFIWMTAQGSANNNYYNIANTKVTGEDLEPASNGWSIANSSRGNSGGTWWDPGAAIKMKITAVPR